MTSDQYVPLSARHGNDRRDYTVLHEGTPPWIKPRLLSVSGVAHCIVFGGGVRQLQIQVHPDRLMAYRLSISEVLAAARASTGVMGAGFVDTPNQRLLIQTEGQSLTPEILGEVVVAHHEGRSVRLKDVAQVSEMRIFTA